MYKKISIILAVTMLVCFVGTAACLPLAGRQTIDQINDMLDDYDITPEVIAINSDTIKFGGKCYYFATRQSSTDKSYVECYDKDLINSGWKWQVEYDTENVANVNCEAIFGRASYKLDNIKRTVVKEIQNYPDAIIYISKNATLDFDELTDAYNFRDIEFKNKAEIDRLLSEYEQKSFDEEVEEYEQGLVEIEEQRAELEQNKEEFEYEKEEFERQKEEFEQEKEQFEIDKQNFELEKSEYE